MHAHIKKGNNIYSLNSIDFVSILIDWYKSAKRELPWRETKDPYQIWLSEIILQQTRVDQGMPYWFRFVHRFPTVKDLASASEKEVLSLWEGLGYYSRARNLHASAKMIVDHYGGEFPKTYDEILKLKGIGPYTAAAISSFCFGEAKPVIDGNVFRFIARYFGLSNDIALTKTRKVFENRLNKIIPIEDPGSFNQAIMEFGATICTPRAQCKVCVFANTCTALLKNQVEKLPVKTKKIKIKKRYLNYIVFKCADEWLFNKRTKNDIWRGLYDFYLLEEMLEEEEVYQRIKRITSAFTIEEISPTFKHLLSHQKLMATFFLVSVDERSLKIIAKENNLEIVKEDEVVNLPKPKLILTYLSSLSHIN